MESLSQTAVLLAAGVLLLMISIYLFSVIGRVRSSSYDQEYCAKEKHLNQNGTGHEHGMVLNEQGRIVAQSKVSQSFAKAVS